MRSVHEFLLKELFVSCCVNAMASTWSVKCEVVYYAIFFFKFNRNSNDTSPLVILLKFITMSSSKASSNNGKVESNLKSRCSNPIMQLVCSSGLLTFVFIVALDLFEI